MNRFFITAALLLSAYCLFGQTTKLTLIDVIELAQHRSTASKAAETIKENYYWEYRSYKARYNPSLNLSGNLPGYYRDFVENRRDDGQIIFQNLQQLNSNLNLGLVQPLSFTGGSISANSQVVQFQDLTSDFTTYNTTIFNMRLIQPIFGFNELKWDRRTEPLRYEESKRSYVEDMEAISQRVTELYFNYLSAQVRLQIAQFNLANNDTIYNIEEGRYNIGKASKDKLLQVELQLLRSQQDVAQANLDLQTTRLQLRSYIGLQDSTSTQLELMLPNELPDFDIDMQKALAYARENRSDYIAFERRRIEANRELARAKSQRFQTNIIASFGLNDSDPIISETYRQPNNQQRFDVALNIPILDWGRSKSRVQTAIANQRYTDYVLDQEIQNFEQEIITLVNRFEVLRLQVDITRKSDEVAQERYNVAQNRYLIGKISITDLNIALTEKDNAKSSYLGALREFWVAYFSLRRLTLYDFLNDELLYQDRD